jgi:Uma2 family endonuclease
VGSSGVGSLRADERCELLDGIIVSAPQQGPLHAAGVRQALNLLLRVLGPDALFSSQLPLIVQPRSVPEPDLAILSGKNDRYWKAHPDSALLVIEVADSSVLQDRLTKSRIYAGAGVPEYWIVNLRRRCIEWFRDPDRELRVYRGRGQARGSERLTIAAFPHAELTAAEFFPSDIDADLDS